MLFAGLPTIVGSRSMHCTTYCTASHTTSMCADLLIRSKLKLLSLSRRTSTTFLARIQIYAPFNFFEHLLTSAPYCITQFFSLKQLGPNLESRFLDLQISHSLHVNPFLSSDSECVRVLSHNAAIACSYLAASLCLCQLSSWNLAAHAN